MNEPNAYGHLLELVKQRRTIRRFRPDPAPDEYVRKIVDVARWAPSGFHTQSWEFAVVRKMEEFGPPIKNRSGDTPEGDFRDAPVFIILFCDWRARTGLPAAARDNDALVANIFGSSMASAFLYMHLAAACAEKTHAWCLSAH